MSSGCRASSFVVQRLQANPDPPFSGPGVIGYDPEEQRYFTRSYEPRLLPRLFHGGGRGVDLHRRNRTRVEFADNGETQRIHWEFKHGEAWLPLSDRVARRVRH